MLHGVKQKCFHRSTAERGIYRKLHFDAIYYLQIDKAGLEVELGVLEQVTYKHDPEDTADEY